jgi:hypothetical protein
MAGCRIFGRRKAHNRVAACVMPTDKGQRIRSLVRRDVQRRTIEASAYDIVNENDLQYLIAAKASAMPMKKAPHSHAGPPVFMPR